MKATSRHCAGEVISPVTEFLSMLIILSSESRNSSNSSIVIFRTLRNILFYIRTRKRNLIRNQLCNTRSNFYKVIKKIEHIFDIGT